MNSNYTYDFVPANCNRQLPCDLQMCMAVASQSGGSVWGCQDRCCMTHNVHRNRSIDDFPLLCSFIRSEPNNTGIPCTTFQVLGPEFEFRIFVSDGSFNPKPSSTKPSSGSSTASSSFLGQMGLLMLILHIFL